MSGPEPVGMYRKLTLPATYIHVLLHNLALCLCPQ